MSNHTTPGRMGLNPTEEEMKEIVALNKNETYYHQTPELLKKYVEMVPPVDEQK